MDVSKIVITFDLWMKSIKIVASNCPGSLANKSLKRQKQIIHIMKYIINIVTYIIIMDETTYNQILRFCSSSVLKYPQYIYDVTQDKHVDVKSKFR